VKKELTHCHNYTNENKVRPLMKKLRPRKSARKEVPAEKRQARVLKAVTAINAVMFGVEAICGGWFAHSTALVADSFDMLGDALGAGTGLLVRKKPPRTQAWAALGKAGFMGVLGLSVLTGAALLLAHPVIMPVAATMAIVGGLALTANTTCALMLWRYRNDNINIKATLICTRNDMVSNALVLGASGLARLLVSPIPDIAVGMGISALFITSSVKIARESIKILRAPENAKQKKPRKNKPGRPAPPHRTEPKIVLGFKKLLRPVFNRKAAATKKTPAPAAQETPAQKPAADKPEKPPVHVENELPVPANA
jgi:Co/Zn/Cd efflux system component